MKRCAGGPEAILVIIQLRNQETPRLPSWHFAFLPLTNVFVVFTLPLPLATV
jgi:hypothetical protein